MLHGDYEPKHYVLLVTDGYSDDDFRDYPDPGCDCAARGNCPANEDPASMSCPYPEVVEAARLLHYGYNSGTCDGPVAQVQVVGYSVIDDATRVGLEAVASAAGS